MLGLTLLAGDGDPAWGWPQWLAIGAMILAFLWGCAAIGRLARPRQDSEQ